MQYDKLSKAEWIAIDYLGSHPKTHAKVGTGRPISTRTFNRLHQLGLVIWASEEHKVVTLSTSGACLWTQRQPTRKHK